MAGCDPRYNVRYQIGGVDASVDSGKITRIEWGREIDQISRAKVVHVLKDAGADCCNDLSKIEPIRDKVAIIKDGVGVWEGWILRVHYFRDRVEVEAEGAMMWLRRRVPEEEYALRADLADHFQNLWDLCMLGSDVNVNIVTFPTGVIESRAVDERGSYRTGWSIFGEMRETGLDAVEIGSAIYAGDLTSISPQIELTLDDFRGDVALTKDGNLYANQALVDGARGVTARFPPERPYPGTPPYPRVVDVLLDEQLQDVTSARAAAKARIDYSPIVPRIVRAANDVALSPNSAIRPENLLPGALAALDTTGLCYAQRESYRIGRVTVAVTGAGEETTLGLQPVGTLGQLENYSFDDDQGSIDAPIEDDLA